MTSHSNPNRILHFIGIAVIVFIASIIVFKVMKFQLVMIEGMTSSHDTPMENVASIVSRNNNKISDEILIDQYRATYETVMDDLHETVNLTVLKEIVKNAETISADPMSVGSQTIMRRIQLMEDFKKSIDGADSYLNGKASIGGVGLF